MAVDSSLRSPLRDLDEEISEAARLPPDIEEEEPLLPGEEASPASAEVRREVKRAHVNLGHCSKAILLRCMRASKCSPEHLAYAKRFRCALCAQRAAPGQVRPAAPPGVPKQFGEAVIIDLRFEKDSAGTTFPVLDVLDVATKYSAFLALKNKTPEHILEVFWEHWVGTHFPPELVSHDLGGEFDGAMKAFIEWIGADTRVGPTEAPWMQAQGERHGAVLGDITRLAVEETQAVGYEEM